MLFRSPPLLIPILLPCSKIRPGGAPKSSPSTRPGHSKQPCGNCEVNAMAGFDRSRCWNPLTGKLQPATRYAGSSVPWSWNHHPFLATGGEDDEVRCYYQGVFLLEPDPGDAGTIFFFCCNQAAAGVKTMRYGATTIHFFFWNRVKKKLHPLSIGDAMGRR